MEENFYQDVHEDRKKHGGVTRNLERDPDIRESNRELILRFDRFCRANRTSYSRRHYVQQLGRFARWLGDKDFREAPAQEGRWSPGAE